MTQFQVIIPGYMILGKSRLQGLGETSHITSTVKSREPWIDVGMLVFRTHSPLIQSRVLNAGSELPMVGRSSLINEGN